MPIHRVSSDTTAVVSDAHPDAVHPPLERNVDPAGSPVTRGVDDRLASDPDQMLASVGIEQRPALRFGLAGDAYFHRDAGTSL